MAYLYASLLVGGLRLQVKPGFPIVVGIYSYKTGLVEFGGTMRKNGIRDH